MADRNDLLNSIKNVVKGGLPTHRVGDFSSDSSKNATGEKQLDIEDEIISHTGRAAFGSMVTARIFAWLEKRRDQALANEVITVPYTFARHLAVLERPIKRPSDLLKSALVPAAAEINASDAPFSVAVSLVRDGSAISGVSFVLESRSVPVLVTLIRRPEASRRL